MQSTPGGSDEDPADALVTALLTASRALVGVSARSLESLGNSVTLTQFRLLVVLEGHGPSRLNQLAGRLEVSPSSALRTVDRLIKADLVARRENEHDRREVVIELTPQGRRLVSRVTRSRRAAIAEIVAQMPPEQHQALSAALTAFAAAADEPSLHDAATQLGW